MAETARTEPGPARAPHSSGLVAGLRAEWVAMDRGEFAVVLSLLGLSVAIRLMRLQPIEYYDDEVTRWHFIRQWFYPNEFRHAVWTHHMARFGLNVPVFFTMLLFGRQATTYYAWPVISFALQVLFAYLVAKRLGGRSAGVVAAILLSVFTGLDRGASQLLPDTFASTAMILVAYLMMRYQEAEPARRLPWLIGSALAFIWAYLIKESDLLFLPGAALAVWYCRGRFKDGVIFCAVLFGFIALETLGYRIFTDYSSRFSIVGEAHGDIEAGSGFWYLFERFARLELPWQMLVWAWVPSALWLLGTKDRRAPILVFLPAGFLFLLTFLVRSVDPLVIWTRFYSRYFDPVAALLVVGVALLATESVRRAWQANAPARLSELPARLAGYGVPITLGCVLLTGNLAYAAARENVKDHPAREVRRWSSILNDAYRRNLPIVEAKAKRGTPEERRVRSLKAVYGIYLKDQLLSTSDLAKNGEVPNILDAVRDSRHYSYVVHDAGVYGPEQVEQYVEKGCAVVVTEQKNHLSAAHGVPSLIVLTEDKLPKGCQPPERR
jgi:hypothetical protein